MRKLYTRASVVADVNRHEDVCKLLVVAVNKPQGVGIWKYKQAYL
jgi:hypothetical protein